MDSLYDLDENQWLEQQISLLKTGDMSALDRANLIEYLTAMAARDKRELQGRLTVLLAHVLKVKFQPSHISRSWANTIGTQQREIRLLLKSMPSLVPFVATIFDEAYEDAVKQAAGETGSAAAAFRLAAAVYQLSGRYGRRSAEPPGRLKPRAYAGTPWYGSATM